MNIFGRGRSYLQRKGEGVEPRLFVVVQLKCSKISFLGGGGDTKASFAAGLVKVPEVVLSIHERPMPFELINTSSTRPRGQMLLGVKSSSIHRSSVFSSGSSSCVHLILLMRVGAYSLSRRLQKLLSLSSVASRTCWKIFW